MRFSIVSPVGVKVVPLLEVRVRVAQRRDLFAVVRGPVLAALVFAEWEQLVGREVFVTRRDVEVAWVDVPLVGAVEPGVVVEGLPDGCQSVHIATHTRVLALVCSVCEVKHNSPVMKPKDGIERSNGDISSCVRPHHPRCPLPKAPARVY